MTVAETSHLAGREGGQRVGDRSVAVLGGVLVTERSDRVRVAAARISSATEAPEAAAQVSPLWRRSW
jgi:hypothetical protein